MCQLSNMNLAPPNRMALYLLKDNPGEVLRRLAVICLEDAVLPPAYPALVEDLLLNSASSKVEGRKLNCTLCLTGARTTARAMQVWLMASSSKGYNLSRDHVNLVLTIVQQVCVQHVSARLSLQCTDGFFFQFSW